MRTHGTHVSARTQVTQMLGSLPPLVRAGVLRTGGPRESAGLIGAVGRWGMSLAALVEMSATSFPHRTALIDDHGSLSYAELRDQARALARSLRTYSEPDGPDGADISSISVIARNSRGLVLPLIAAAYLGAEAKILNPGSSLTQLQDIADDYPSSVTFIDAEFTEVLEKLSTANKVTVAEWSGDAQAHAPGQPGQPASLESLVAAGRSEYRHVALPGRPAQRSTVIMSSGTRGVPKAVVLPVPRTPKVLGSILERIPFRSGDVIQLSVGLFHAWGWLNLHISMATGSTLLTRRWFDSETDIRDIVRHDVTGIVSAAVYLRQILAGVGEHVGAGVGGGVDVSGIRYIVSAGNAIPPELVVELNARFGDGTGVVHNFYGSTEHGQITLATAADLAADPTTAGRPGPGVRLAIIGDDGRPVAPGGTGVIYSSNSMTSLGFLSDKDSGDVVDGMLSTGDTGFIDDSGRLYVCGRADDMVIRGGENIHPRAIEEFLLTLPQIRDAFVIGHQGDLVATLDAYIVTDHEITDGELNDAVLAGVNRFCALDNIVRVETLPRNDSGKVVPRLLPDTPGTTR
ncbi:AMP-binding protein [Corynebacterium kalidii]|uniref:AMP-binding protein n=1 Tax=Corynebacterium kalidii TaxID=2931982 RepID=A0A9X1WGL5_9CORY|nr:AMP-binding protein [Corynebacterium kalidii]MCJ7857212.1 AMP-binding protein [Corynebacterium kalidii]